MTDANKMTFNKNGEMRNFNHFSDTAYHMDAALFGNYLRDQVCIPNGLDHILATVTKINQDENGDISSVTTDKGDLTADLYIDCTGFKSLLLDETLKVPFVSFHDTLHNDRAIATCIPYVDIEKEMECVTNCTAIECGWVWNIPLWNRIGTGYVYSSKFATEEEALEQFKKHLKSNTMVCSDEKRVDEAQFRFIKIKHGVHKRAWEKNVVGVGLSNGFIEPLESTGLMLTHEAIIKLVNVLKMRDGNVTRFEIDSFNYALYDHVLDFKNFISSHYALSMRNDTPYWKEVSQNTTYSQKMNDYEPGFVINQCANLAYMNLRDRNYPNNMSGTAYIAAGMGYNPTDNARVDYLDKTYMEPPNFYDHVYEKWTKHRDQVLQTIEKLPTHYQFLKDNIYND